MFLRLLVCFASVIHASPISGYAFLNEEVTNSTRACGLVQALPNVFHAAVNSEHWNMCSRCAMARYGAKTITVQITNQCIDCGAGDIDLPMLAFQELAGGVDAPISIEWMVIDCPVEDQSILVCIDRNNANLLQPAHARNGVKIMRVNGKNAPFIGTSFHFALPEDLSLNNKVHLEMVSWEGETVQGVVQLKQGVCTSTGLQFQRAVVAESRSLTDETTTAEHPPTTSQQDAPSEPSVAKISAPVAVLLVSCAIIGFVGALVYMFKSISRHRSDSKCDKEIPLECPVTAAAILHVERFMPM